MKLTVTGIEEGILPEIPIITFRKKIDLLMFDLFVFNMEFR